MNTPINIATYFEDIENRIVENINETKSSIHIAVAWFTSKEIKQALIDLKRDKPDIIIEIVVDDNEVNKSYFLNTKPEFEQCGIVIHPKVEKKFLHRKFMVVDGLKVLTGSYNFTRKAKSNLESVTLITDPIQAAIHLRIFKRMTNHNYVDENIRLLMEYPEFAQQIISTYYPFTAEEYRKYKNKIVLGSCFTVDVGDYDEIRYTPGFIFNPKYKLDHKLEKQEFSLPVSKGVIKDWIESRNERIILESYREYEELYHEINGSLEKAKEKLEEYFQRLIESTHTYNELKQKIESNVNIISEDSLWANNYQMFMSKQLLEDLFDGFPIVEKNYSWLV